MFVTLQRVQRVFREYDETTQTFRTVNDGPAFWDRIGTSMTKSGAMSQARSAKKRMPHGVFQILPLDEYRARIDELDPLTTTRNLLNPNAKDIPIRSSEKGTCVDPGTETYHSM